MEQEQEIIVNVEESNIEHKKQKRSLKKVALIFLSTLSIGIASFTASSDETDINDVQYETDFVKENLSREDAKQELVSRDVSLEEAEKMMDAEKEANERLGILGTDNKETQKTATENAQELVGKVIDAEQGANKRQGILGVNNEETKKKAETEARTITVEIQSVYDEAYESAFDYYRQCGSKVNAPIEESHYMNYNATDEHSLALENSARLGYTDGKNAGIAEYNANGVHFEVGLEQVIEHQGNLGVDNNETYQNEELGENTETMSTGRSR